MQLILHQKAVAERTPNISVLVVDLDRAIKVFNGSRIVFSTSADVGGLGECAPRVGVHGEYAFIGLLSPLEITHRLGRSSDSEPDALRRLGLALKDRDG